MQDALRRRYIAEVISDLHFLTGATFERFCYRFINDYAPRDWHHRGTNTAGNPVGHVVDSVAEAGHSVAQYSSEEGYFKKGFAKISKDLRATTRSHPEAQEVFLLSTHEAGPSATTSVNRLRAAWLRRGVSLDILDARKIADHLAENIFNDTWMQDLSQFLPVISKWRSEWALTNAIPPSSHYVSRPADESAVLKQLEERRYLSVSGISGIGKSAMCAALARNSNGYDIVLWIDARHLTSIDDLHDYHVARSSSSINLFALVRSRPCWLIFDNLQVALDSDMLLATMHAGSRVLATSQHKGHGSYELRDVDRETARNILEQHAALKCPDDVWLLIDATVGGYPLLLELMGALARTEGWDAVREVCPDAIRLDDRRYERVCDRILARHRASLQEELTFLRWLDSRVMDPRLLRYVAGSTAARRLDARGLLIPSSDESLRIHDMVHASINATVPHPDAISDALYARKMDAFFATHDDRLLRDRAARIHRVVLARLLQTGGAGPSVRHSYVTVYKGDADPILLRSPEQMAEALTRTAPEALSAEVHATIEEIEAHYVITRDRDGAAAGQQRLAEFLPLISKALTRVVSDLSLHRYVLHHQGKFLFWLGRYNDAERLFSELLATSPEYAEPRLQRAILYNRSDRPQPALLDIEFLFNQQHQQKNVSVTVQLAALAQLVRHANERIGELIDNNREDIDAAFRSAIATRHPIALEAMEALGSSLGYERPNFVAEFLDYFGGWQPSTNKERLSWAGVLKQFGKALRNVDGSRAQTLLAEAANWYSQTIITTDYQASQAADAFLEINRPDTAWDALGASMEAHSPFWLQRAAQVLLALERPEDALQHIDQALSLLNDKQQRYRAAMFQDRFRIRQRLSDPRAREDLEAAVHASSSPKFREELLRQLQEWDRSATTGDASDS